jgi:CDP-diacylglycerol--glycerol-3-phosphate 3-phosphatidyltransferase
MDIGLYNLKYPFRKTILWLLPLVRDISPNVISWSLLPVGIVTALCYYHGQEHHELYLAGAGLIFLRMIISTLDGLAAVTFQKCTPNGEIVNRIAPELCDTMLMIAIILAEREHFEIGMLALIVCWLTSFAGLVGCAGGKKIQSVGPVGQTDRIAVLLILSLITPFTTTLSEPFDILYWFLWWCVVGGVATIFIRFYRQLTEENEASAAGT